MPQERKRCEECGAVAKPRQIDDSCPACGAKMTTDQLLDVTVELNTPFPLIMDVANAPGPRDKAPIRIVIKNELHWDTGRWQQAHRTFDKGNNRYVEKITDWDTGEVVRETDEPLDEHQGHGSARRVGEVEDE